MLVNGIINSVNDFYSDGPLYVCVNVCLRVAEI